MTVQSDVGGDAARRDPRGVQPARAAGTLPRLAQRHGAARGGRARRRRLGRLNARCLRRRGRRPAVRGRLPRRAQPAAVPFARPLRPAQQPGRVPPRLPRADARGDRGRPALAAVDRGARRCARGARGARVHAQPGRFGQRLPADHDLCRDPGAAAAARRGRGLDPSRHRARLRRLQPALAREGRHHARHGDDREAGRHRCARQHHARTAARRRRPRRAVRADRPQMVLLGADVRRLPRAGSGAGRAVVLPAAALASRRRPERPVRAAPEEQAGQPLQRLQRDRAARGARRG